MVRSVVAKVIGPIMSLTLDWITILDESLKNLAISSGTTVIESYYPLLYCMDSLRKALTVITTCLIVSFCNCVQQKTASTMFVPRSDRYSLSIVYVLTILAEAM